MREQAIVALHPQPIDFPGQIGILIGVGRAAARREGEGEQQRGNGVAHRHNGTDRRAVNQPATM
jgi:hypothetical protein